MNRCVAQDRPDQESLPFQRTAENESPQHCCGTSSPADRFAVFLLVVRLLFPPYNSPERTRTACTVTLPLLAGKRVRRMQIYCCCSFSCNACMTMMLHTPQLQESLLDPAAPHFVCCQMLLAWVRGSWQCSRFVYYTSTTVLYCSMHARVMHARAIYNLLSLPTYSHKEGVPPTGALTRGSKTSCKFALLLHPISTIVEIQTRSQESRGA